jgi:PAS domain S-box-containing protein
MSRDMVLEERILVLAPHGRDARVVEQVLSAAGFHCVVCADHHALTLELERGAGAALVAEEAFLGVDLAPLADWLAQQASWSDFPFVLLVLKRTVPSTGSARALLENVSNAVLLERPLNAETLRRAAASALRARKRQYQARSDLLVRTHAEDHLRIALQAGRLGSWQLDLRSLALHASDTCKAHFGRDPSASLTYDDVLAAVHPDDRERRRLALDAVFAAESAFNIEYRVVWPDGSVHWIHAQGSSRGASDTGPALMAGVTQDVTDRREAERQLRKSQTALRLLNENLENRIQTRTAELAQANDRLMREITERERTQLALVQAQKMEAIGRLTGGIAHDFNNLLNVIMGNLDLIDHFSADERIKRMAAVARKSTQRGAKLTGQLLAFSRSHNLDLKPLDLALVVEGARDLLSASLGTDVELRFALEADMPLVRADLNQIELALLNLAINARDAMPEGGLLTICTSLREAPHGLLPDGRYAVVSVNDTGLGIGPEILSKVFDPFFTTKALGKGTGLGLSQVYGIAQQSGGTARIESTPGTGTTVEIWLPLADPGHAAEPPPGNGAGATTNNPDAKILVVEDDPEVRQFIVECLDMLGYRVAQAEHGQAGLEHLNDEPPDLLIVDFLMPGMNGAELVAQATSRFPDLPVIIATGYADMDAVEKVIGSNFILRKPFRIDDLAESVRRALAC